MKVIVNEDEIEIVSEGREDISALARFIPPARVEVIRVGLETQPSLVGRMAFRAVAAADDPIFQEIKFLAPAELQARVLGDARYIAQLEERLRNTCCYWCGESVSRDNGAEHWKVCAKHPARQVILDVYDMLDSDHDAAEIREKIEKIVGKP